MLETGMAELAAANCPKALIVEMEDILSEGHERGWGTDYRRELTLRNRQIRDDWNEGMKVDALARKYHLSEKSI